MPLLKDMTAKEVTALRAAERNIDKTYSNNPLLPRMVRDQFIDRRSAPAALILLLGSFQLRRTEAAIRRLRRGTLFRPIIRTSTSFRTESPCLYECNPWIRNSAGSCGCGHRTSPYCA